MRDGKRCGREKDIRTLEMIVKISKFLNDDFRASLLMIATQFEVGEATAQNNS